MKQYDRTPHLRQLKSGGLITSRRVGKEVYYKAADTMQAQSLHHMIEKMVEITCPGQEKVTYVKMKPEMVPVVVEQHLVNHQVVTDYTIGAAEGRLVAGTGNRSEAYMGYFTKWGDGAYDFNPIADLTVTEIYEFLTWLHAPENIIRKAPSAGLFEGQTDEQEMGVTYAAIDKYILTGEASEHDKAIIDRYHSRSEHKRRPAATYHAE